MRKVQILQLCLLTSLSWWNLQATEIDLSNYEWAETPRIIKLSKSYSDTGLSCNSQQEFELCIGPTRLKSGVEADGDPPPSPMVKCFIPKNRFECPTVLTLANQCVLFESDQIANAGEIRECEGSSTDNLHYKCQCITRYIPASERYYVNRHAQCIQENSRRRQAATDQRREREELAAREAACVASDSGGTWSGNQCNCQSPKSPDATGRCVVAEAAPAVAYNPSGFFSSIRRNVCEYVAPPIPHCIVETEGEGSEE